MYTFVEQTYDIYGYPKKIKYKRPYPCNFFTRQFLGYAVNEDNTICIFIDFNSDKTTVNSFEFVPNYSLSVCKILEDNTCSEISEEPLWLKSITEVINYINKNYDTGTIH